MVDLRAEVFERGWDAVCGGFELAVVAEGGALMGLDLRSGARRIRASSIEARKTPQSVSPIRKAIPRARRANRWRMRPLSIGVLVGDARPQRLHVVNRPDTRGVEVGVGGFESPFGWATVRLGGWLRPSAH